MVPVLRTKPHRMSKDENFYFSLIAFQVEDCLFKVNREPFIEESEVFSEMFELPNVGGDGDDEEHPLVLEGITKDEFRPFLRALNAKQHHDSIGLPIAEWESVLKLAHMWAFTSLRKKAVKEIDSFSSDDLPPISRLHMARKYEIPSRIPKAYSALVDRNEELTDEEAKELGYEDAFKVTRYRVQRKEKMIKHFTAGHVRKRRCKLGHVVQLNFNMPIRPCKDCGQSWEEHIEDGCELFDVPGAPKKRREVSIWGLGR